MSVKNSIEAFLEQASIDYYEGRPIISDEQFDYLSQLVDWKRVGYQTDGTVEHYTKMYSLQNVFVGEDEPPFESRGTIKTPKLDGAAISILYVKRELSMALTRGDGTKGKDITEKISCLADEYGGFQIPFQIPRYGIVMVTGEIVAPKEIKNSRNYAAGALGLKMIDEFLERDLTFVAHGVYPNVGDTYFADMEMLQDWGFTTILDLGLDKFPQDGEVVRVNSHKEFNHLGYTATHPRGAYALKTRQKPVETKIIDVEWQVGKTGRVTPVAILEPVEIGGAMVSRATLNNPGFIRSLGLEIGDRVGVIRSGDIIPCIVCKL